MARDEFERDMHEYLRARRRAGLNIKEILKGLIPKRKPEKIEMPEEIEVYDEKEEAPKAPKEGVFAKMFKKEPAQEEIMQAQMQVEDTITDMKEVSKITLNMIRQLPDEELRKFKQSPDFERLKNILKKHELIK